MPLCCSVSAALILLAAMYFGVSLRFVGDDADGREMIGAISCADLHGCDVDHRRWTIPYNAEHQPSLREISELFDSAARQRSEKSQGWNFSRVFSVSPPAARAGIAAATALSLYAGLAAALDITFGLGDEYQYSDNIRLVAVAPEAEPLHIGRVTVGVSERSSVPTLRGGASIEHRDYVKDTFGDGVYGSVNAAANAIT